MRIAFYNHTGQVSGAEKMLLMGLANLPRDRFELTLVCPKVGQLLAAAEELGVPTFAIRPLNARFTLNPASLTRYAVSILLSLRDVRKRLSELSPDIVHANTVRAGIVATIATLGTGTRIVWHNHDMLPCHLLTCAIRCLAYSSARLHVVGCSAAAARTLRPVLRKKAGPRIIYNGCEVTHRQFDQAARNAKRTELELALSDFVIGIVGQVTPRKGQLELIRAFAEVRKQIPEAVLIICGAPLFNRDGDYLKLMVREAERQALGRNIRFLGQRKDAAEIIGAADLSVLNSRREPFALTLLEAMMMGTPVISTACGGPIEMIEHGVHGEIVPAGDQEALVEAIVRLARNDALRHRYSAAARVMAEERYSREQYIDRWCSFYDEIVDAGSITPRCMRTIKQHLRSQEGGRS